jgi:hypothetical protein
LGYVAGRGRSDLENGGIELQLTCNTRYHVAGRHARFYHNHAGILMIRSDARTVIVDGKEEFRNDQRAITSTVTGLTFGDLTYTLVFTDLAIYDRQLSKLRKENGTSYEPPPFLDPTPSSTDYVLQKYLIKGVFAQGATCVVSAGYNKLTGVPVAIKKIKRRPNNSLNIEDEIKIVQALSPHVSSTDEVFGKLLSFIASNL